MPGAMGGMMMMPGKGGMPPQMGANPAQQQMARPQMMAGGMPGGMAQPRPGAPPDPNAPLSASALAAAPPAMQKQMLGSKLYPAVARYQPELAGKITGMMLEMDNSELLMLLESEVQMKSKVDEALRVLETLNK